MSRPLFYKKQQTFGLDIGAGTVKAVQLLPGKLPTLAGYGFANFDSTCIKDGVIVKPQQIAATIKKLLMSDFTGAITTKNITTNIPISRTYTRTITLPALADKKLEDAVKLEIEQYVPVPMDALYYDWEVINTLATGEIEVIMVAVPSGIADSYRALFSMLDLEVSLFEPSLSALARTVQYGTEGHDPIVMIDLGSKSSDVSIFDQSVRVTGTTKSGGDDITDEIAKALKLNKRQAYVAKAKYGLQKKSKYYNEIHTAIDPILKQIVTETKKMLRFHNQRNEKQIANVVLFGGGSNIPGIDEYMSDALNLKSTVCDPWKNIDTGGLQPPHKAESSLYTTAIGSALVGTTKGTML